MEETERRQATILKAGGREGARGAVAGIPGEDRCNCERERKACIVCDIFFLTCRVVWYYRRERRLGRLGS
jgi:hypothetical protein